MTRNNPVKLPPINPLHTLIKSLPPATTRPIPNQPLLPNRAAPRILQSTEDLGQNPRVGRDGCFAELFGCGEVEEQVGLDEGARGAVVEDEFFVDVGGDVFDVEFGGEFGGDGGWWDAAFGGEEEEVGGGEFEVGLFVAQVGQGVWREDLGVGVGL